MVAGVGGPVVCVGIILVANGLVWATNHNGWLWRHGVPRRWRASPLLLTVPAPAPVAATVHGAAAASTAELLSSSRCYLSWDVLPSGRQYESPLLTSWGLAALRALQAAVFALTLALGSQAYGAPGAASYWLYFTNWTFTAFGAVGAAGALLTLRAAWRARRAARALPRAVVAAAGDCGDFGGKLSSAAPSSAAAGATPAAAAPAAAAAGAPHHHHHHHLDHHHTWPLVDRLYLLALTTVAAASVMLTLFYWLADYDPRSGLPLRGDNPVKHGGSAALLLLDLALSRAPLSSYHVAATVAYGSAYLALLWAWHAATGAWVYRALDWSRPAAPAYYAALPLLLVLGWAAAFAVAGLRELALGSGCFLAGRCCCGGGGGGGACCGGRRRRRHEQGEGYGSGSGGGSGSSDEEGGSPTARRSGDVVLVADFTGAVTTAAVAKGGATLPLPAAPQQEQAMMTTTQQR